MAKKTRNRRPVKRLLQKKDGSDWATVSVDHADTETALKSIKDPGHYRVVEVKREVVVSEKRRLKFEDK